jgi:hypothetical protein
MADTCPVGCRNQFGRTAGVDGGMPDIYPKGAETSARWRDYRFKFYLTRAFLALLRAVISQ